MLAFLLAFVTLPAFAQTVEVKGKVVDDSKVGLPGVSVVAKGTTTGTITDFDGNYVLSVEKGTILVFSFIGFQNQEIALGETVGENAHETGSGLRAGIVGATERR